MAHQTNRRRVKRAMKERSALIVGFMAGRTDYGRIQPMTRDAAERLVAAERRGLDLWAWLQGRVQFLSPRQIDLAMKAGLSSWVEAAVNGSDSADPFYTLNDGWTVLRAYYPEIFSVHTRCAGRQGDHSIWAYGPVYLTKAAAIADGHSHNCACNCGRVDGSLE